MTCILGVENDLIVFDVKIDKLICDSKIACHMIFYKIKVNLTK